MKKIVLYLSILSFGFCVGYLFYVETASSEFVDVVFKNKASQDIQQVKIREDKFETIVLIEGIKKGALHKIRLYAGGELGYSFSVIFNGNNPPVESGTYAESGNTVTEIIGDTEVTTEYSPY